MFEKKRVVNRYSVTTMLAILFASLFSFSALAQPLNMDSINKKILELDERSLQNTTNYEFLADTLYQVDFLQRQINACINTEQKRQAEIDKLIEKVGVNTDLKQSPVSYNELIEDKKNTTPALSYCYLANYKLKAMDVRIRDNIANSHTYFLPIKGLSIYEAFNSQLFNMPSFHLNELYQRSGLVDLTRMQWGGFIFTGIIIAFVGLFLYAPVYFDANLIIKFTRKNSQYLVPLALLALYLNIILCHTAPFPMIILCVNAFILYLVALVIIRITLQYSIKTIPLPNSPMIFAGAVGVLIAIYMAFLLISEAKYDYITPQSLEFHLVTYVLVTIRLALALLANGKKWLEPTQMARFEKSARFLAGILFLGYISDAILTQEQTQSDIYVVMTIIFIALLNIAYFRLIWIILNTFKFENPVIHAYRHIIKNALILLWCLIVLLASEGYQGLAMTFIPHLILSATLMIIIMDCTRLLKIVYISLSNPQYPASQKLRAILGLPSEKKLTELFILRVTFSAAPICLGIFAILELWGVPRYVFSLLFNQLHFGYDILGFTIHPAKIIRGANVFCIIILLSRALTTYLVRHVLVSEDQHAQTVLVSLMHYVFFVIALLMAFLIAGFHLQGLMITMGALSVGIGFGLQSFARDFVSGIVILFNKPVKIGDHVMISNCDGYIKQIGAFSTQIRTLSHTDIFIPNSTIISSTITNYTFRSNKLYRLKITIIIEKVSDRNSGQQLLLTIATKNPRVIQDSSNQPTVFFDADELNLSCVIDDVNKKESIASELYFEITKVFEENKIPMKLAKEHEPWQ